MARIRGVDPQRRLAIPVDVGKATAVALVADHYGEILVAPFEFALTEAGFAVLSAATTRAQVERDALIVRIGVEAAGHYHRTLVARLRAAGLEVVELNLRAVKDARGQQFLRTLKSDAATAARWPTARILARSAPPPGSAAFVEGDADPEVVVVLRGDVGGSEYLCDLRCPGWRRVGRPVVWHEVPDPVVGGAHLGEGGPVSAGGDSCTEGRD